MVRVDLRYCWETWREGAVEDRHTAEPNLLTNRDGQTGVLNKMIPFTYKTVPTAKPLTDGELLGRMRVSILHRAWPLGGGLHYGAQQEGGRGHILPELPRVKHSLMLCGGNPSHPCRLVTCG